MERREAPGALTAKQVTAAIQAGGNRKISDGHSLYLVIKNVRGFWVHQFREGPVIRSKGLGPVATVTPMQARRAREAFTAARLAGVAMPGFAARAPGELFGTAASTYLANHADEWSARHRAGLTALVKTHAAVLAAVPVNRISSDAVADMLRPIWDGPGDNRGSRLRRLVESILTSKDIEPNPAAWARLREKLSKEVAKVENRPAMPFTDVPAYFATLGDDVESRALRFVILTAVRRKEALGALWREFDFANRMWTVPGERMKSGRDHAVPLTDAMIAALGPAGTADAFVFPSKVTGGMLGHKALSLKQHGYTLHGFRSTFASWAEDQDDGKAYPQPIIRAALAHAKGEGDKVTAAYLRSDHFQARRKLMAAWSKFATGNRMFL